MGMQKYFFNHPVRVAIKQTFESRICTFHTRKIKIRISKKIKNSERVNVLFLVQYPEMWNSEKRVYQLLKEDNRFNTSILCVPKYREINNEISFSENNDAYEYLRDKCSDIIDAFNGGAWINLSSLNPDYLFVQRPYTSQLPPIYHFSKIRKCSLLCYIPYSGRSTIGIHLRIELNPEFLKYFYAFFADCYESFRFVSDWISFRGYDGWKKVYNLGYPRNDLINEMGKDSACRSKFLWLPRWSLNEENNKSHFIEYIEPMINYFSAHKDLSLVIRPHPLMFMNFIRENAMTIDEVEELKKRISKLTNISFDQNEDYLNTFESTDVLIGDASSLVAEFFHTMKPIIYCDVLNDATHDGWIMNETFYMAKSFDDITSSIEMILENDPKETLRTESKGRLNTHDRHASERIIEALIKDANDLNGLL